MSSPRAAILSELKDGTSLLKRSAGSVMFCKRRSDRTTDLIVRRETYDNDLAGTSCSDAAKEVLPSNDDAEGRGYGPEGRQRLLASTSGKRKGPQACLTF